MVVLDNVLDIWLNSVFFSFLMLTVRQNGKTIRRTDMFILMLYIFASATTLIKNLSLTGITFELVFLKIFLPSFNWILWFVCRQTIMVLLGFLSHPPASTEAA